MIMSKGNVSGERISQAEQQLQTHGEILESHDRRISLNENYRLQLQGALKFAAFALGSGAIGTGAIYILHLGGLL